jgi:hypothetical protein
MVDGPGIVGDSLTGKVSSSGTSSSGISSRLDEQGLVVGNGCFGLSLAFSLALLSQCS